MLSLSLAFLLALPLADATTADTGPLRQRSLVPPTLVPHGTMTGSWVAGTLLGDGVLVALIEDAEGRPLYVLDAVLTATGHFSGELRPLEYATNPVLGLLPLEAVGEALIPDEGPGSFSGVIYCPLLDDLPFPLGRMEGVLTRGMRRASKLDLSAAEQHNGALGEKDQNMRPPFIVCPWGPGIVVSQVTAVDTLGSAGGRATAPDGSSVLSSAVPIRPPPQQVGHSKPADGEGVLLGRWILLL